MSCPLTKLQTKKKAGRNFRQRGRKSTFHDKNHSFTIDPVPTPKTLAKYIVWFGTFKNYLGFLAFDAIPNFLFPLRRPCGWTNPFFVAHKRRVVTYVCWTFFPAVFFCSCMPTLLYVWGKASWQVWTTRKACGCSCPHLHSYLVLGLVHYIHMSCLSLSIKRTETGELRIATNLCGLSGYMYLIFVDPVDWDSSWTVLQLHRLFSCGSCN